MNVTILDVLLIDDIWLNNSNDVRPCVVIDTAHNNYLVVMLVSGAYELRRPNLDFAIPKIASDFKYTGLTKPSYVLGDEIHEISETQILKKLGQLQGDLGKDFKKWLGL